MADVNPTASSRHQNPPPSPPPRPCPEKYCSRCAKLQGVLPDALSACAQCKTALYCSRECQRKDWKIHKHFCSTWAKPENKGRLSLQGLPLSRTAEWLEPHIWLHCNAPSTPAARVLAAELGVELHLSCSLDSCRLIDATLSRLVCTGRDTDLNLGLLYGDGNVADLKTTKAYVQLRFDAYSGFPVRSYGFHAIQIWDREIPMRSWTPRPPTEAETAKFLQVAAYCSWILCYLDTPGSALVVDNVPLLLSFGRQVCARNRTWPFTNDSLDELDSMRQALKGVADVGYVDMDLESLGLGFFDIPDEIPSLMRKEGLGLKEATLRVFGEAPECVCVDCNTLRFPVLPRTSTS